MGFALWQAMEAWQRRQWQGQMSVVRVRPLAASSEYVIRKVGQVDEERSFGQRENMEQLKEDEAQQTKDEAYKEKKVDSEQLFRNEKGTKKWVAWAEYQQLHGLED